MAEAVQTPPGGTYRVEMIMEKKPGYKQTEVGVIPENWEMTTIGDVCTFSGGSQPPRYTFKFAPTKGYIRLIQIRDYKSDEYASYIPEPLARKRCTAEDIMIGRYGPPIFQILRGIDGAYNVALIKATPTQKVDREFFFNILKQDALFQVIESLSRRTSGQTGVEMPALKSYGLALPPIPEQRAIATALSDVDALLAALDRLIVKQRDLKQAAMQQLLTGQTRLPGFGPSASFKQYAYGSIPDDWDVKPLKSVSTMNGRIGWQGLKQEEFTMSPDDPFLITGMNFKDGKIRWDEVYHIPEKRYLEAAPIQLRPNDVLMTKDGTIGKLLYVDCIPNPGRASLNSHLLVFRPIADQYNPKFLFYQLSSPTFAQHVELHKSGTTFFGLSQTATGKYPTILPTLPEQTAIATVLSDMDLELAALEQRRDKTRALKQGMMQELLTGRTRLV